MKVFNGIDKPIDCQKPIVTIGTFDGMHLGHQKIIKQLILAAKKINGESVLITFYPHPRSIINSNEPLKLLQNQAEKINKLEELGLDHLVVIPFTTEFSKLTAVEFVQSIIKDKLHCHTLVIGYDHHFGNNREGNLAFLQANAKKFDFEIIEIPAKEIDAIKISSTKIRSALLDGNIEIANAYLGYPYELNGVVVSGKKLGRKIGFPTANISLTDTNKLIPQLGVYAVKAVLHGQTLYGMLNIGTNPTVEDSASIKLEVHLFNFNSDIYDNELSIQLYSKIRPEGKFDNLQALTTQLQQDEIVVRKYFSLP